MSYEAIEGRPTGWSRSAIYFHYHNVSGESRSNWKRQQVLKEEAAARSAAEMQAFYDSQRELEARRQTAFLMPNTELTPQEAARRSQAQFLTNELERNDPSLTFLQVR